MRVGRVPELVTRHRRAAAGESVDVRLDGAQLARRCVGGTWVESVVAPGTPAGRTVVYFHGGAFVLGLRDRHRRYAVELSRRVRAEVLLVDYRIAPEDPFPAAVEDGRVVYEATSGSVAVVSDSAGSAVLVGTLLSALADGHPPPVGAVLFSPWYDLECRWQNHLSDGSPDPVVDRDELLAFSHLYAGGAHRLDPRANSILADLTGLPPTLVLAGEREVLVADARSLRDRACSAGVSCELRVWPDAGHGFQLRGGPAAEEASAVAAGFLEARLAVGKG